MDKIKKLSEAIRLGATIRPKCVGAFFDRVENGEVGSCALGAAYEAITGDCTLRETKIMATLALRFKVSEFDMSNIMDWNDGADLTREEIADKLKAVGM